MLIRKNIRPGFLFCFLCLFSSFSADPGNLWCFPLEKSEIRTLFHDFDTRISLNSSEKEETTGGRITALLSLTPESAIFPEPKDGNLRRWGFKGTSERLFSITLMDRMCSCIFFGIFSASFFFFFANLWNLWCFPPEKSEIRTLFYVFDTQISLNGSKKDGKEKSQRDV